MFKLPFFNFKVNCIMENIIGKIVTTNNHWHKGKLLRTLKRLNGKFVVDGKEVVMICCVEENSSQKLFLNLPEDSLTPVSKTGPDFWSNSVVLKLASKGNKVALDQFKKRFGKDFKSKH